MTEHDLLEALRDCFVPPRGRNVVDLGLVRSVQLAPDPEAPGAGIAGVPPRFAASVILQAPGSDEAVNAQLRALVENRLAGLAELSRADIALLPPLFPMLPARRTEPIA